MTIPSGVLAHDHVESSEEPGYIFNLGYRVRCKCGITFQDRTSLPSGAVGAFTQLLRRQGWVLLPYPEGWICGDCNEKKS